MKKRLMCLCLCLLLVLPLALTACSSEEDNSLTSLSYATGSTARAETLTLYTIKNDDMTEEAVARIQDALNAYTELEFNTHIVLRMYTEEEYQQVLAEKIRVIEQMKKVQRQLDDASTSANRATKSAGISTTPVTTGEQDESNETTVNEVGMTVSVYPSVKDNQLDIFLITNRDDYITYVNEGLISSLETTVSVTYSHLYNYINPLLINAAKVDGNLYAIPNNHMLGEYEFLLIDRALADKYYLDVSSISTMSDLSDFLKIISTYEHSYVPMINVGSSFAFSPLGEHSVIGAYLTNSTIKSAGTAAEPSLLLTKRSYRNYLSFLYNNANLITEQEDLDNTDFACAVVKGSYALKSMYEDDYYVIDYKVPVVGYDELYSSMYAVSTFTNEPSRAVQILELLTTNTDIINLLAYGIEGDDYEMNHDGTITPLDNGYSMPSLYAGNQFKLYQSTAMTDEEIELSNDNWDVAKTQNLNAVTDPYLGFTISETAKTETVRQEETSEETTDASETEDTGSSETPSETDDEPMKLEELLQGLDELYADFENRVSSFRTSGSDQSFDEFLEKLAVEYATNPFVKEALNTNNNNSILSQYRQWIGA